MGKSDFVVDKDKLEVRTSRVFKATPEQLYRLCSDPEMIPQWWGPAKYKTVVDKMDFKVGGAWRFIQSDESGEEFAFNGVYKEIVPNELISDTFEFEPMPGHVLLETATFENQKDGTTLLTATAHYDNLQDLEGMVSMGMESGQQESHDRLEALLEAG